MKEIKEITKSEIGEYILFNNDTIIKLEEIRDEYFVENSPVYIGITIWSSPTPQGKGRIFRSTGYTSLPLYPVKDIKILTKEEVISVATKWDSSFNFEKIFPPELNILDCKGCFVLCEGEDTKDIIYVSDVYKKDGDKVYTIKVNWVYFYNSLKGDPVVTISSNIAVELDENDFQKYKLLKAIKKLTVEEAQDFCRKQLERYGQCLDITSLIGITNFKITDNEE